MAPVSTRCSAKKCTMSTGATPYQYQDAARLNKDTGNAGVKVTCPRQTKQIIESTIAGLDMEGVKKFISDRQVFVIKMGPIGQLDKILRAVAAIARVREKKNCEGRVIAPG